MLWGKGVKGEKERCGKLKWWEIGASEMAQRSRELAVAESRDSVPRTHIGFSVGYSSSSG